LNAKDIDFAILTHAHIDHAGFLGILVRNGFKGVIISTKKTFKLLRPTLMDGAKIQIIEAKSFNSKNRKNTRPNFVNELTRDQFYGKFDDVKEKRKTKRCQKYAEPLYDFKDVERVCQLVKNRGSRYYEWISISPLVKCMLYKSGHILGGAVVVININDGEHYLCFTGDLGGNNKLLLSPPDIPDIRKLPIRTCVIESTYGGLEHNDPEEVINKITGLLKTAVNKKQKVIIPAFALQRTQDIIYLITHLIVSNKIPAMRIYLDSPLGSDLTQIYSDSWRDGSFLNKYNLKFNPFNPSENKHLHIINDPHETKGLVQSNDSYIVISSAGMCDAGKIRNYIKHNLENESAIILLIGYMAKNTLGSKLKEKPKKITINGDEYDINAQIEHFDMSSHASGSELIDFAKKIIANNGKIVIVHGNEKNAEGLKSGLKNEFLNSEERFNVEVVIPGKNQVYELV
jgi:metallo-beta-lactamase family protein